MKRFLCLCAGMMVLAACATFTQKTQGLRLGMTTSEVKDALGGDYMVKASKYAPDGQPVQAWEFHDPQTHDVYWVYFKGDHLVQWGTPDAIKAMPDLQDATATPPPPVK